MANTILQVNKLSKTFDKFEAVKNISFSIEEGHIVGVLGPNGAGKTTLLQMLLGILTPTEGEIVYFGKRFEDHREYVHEHINFSSTYTNLPWSLTVHENLTFVSYLYAIKNRKERLARLIQTFRIEQLLDKQITQLSAGQVTRVNLAKALINYPKILLLDEPTASLDPEVATYIRSFLQSQREQFNMTILITSHNMAEVEELCDRVLFINKGQIIADDTPDGLARTIEVSHVELFIRTGITKLKEFAEKEHISFIAEGKRIKLNIKETELAAFLQKLSHQHIAYDEISINKPSLEDYFLSVTRKERINQSTTMDNV